MCGIVFVRAREALINQINTRTGFQRKLARALYPVICITVAHSFQVHAEQRQLAAHEHGLAQLNVAVDTTSLSVEYISPAANIVGFEHEPSTEEQSNAIHTARKVLESARVLAVPAGAGCALAEANVAYGNGEREGHGEGHAHQDGDSEREKADHGEFHSEFHVIWRYDCTKASALTHIDVQIFDLFPGNDEIVVQAISPGGQRAAKLTPGSKRLVLP